MPLEMMNQVNKEQAENRVVRNNKTKKIKEIDIKKILSGINSNNYDELYPALLLASGRKPGDLWKREIKRGNKPNSIKIKSKLTKRANDCTIEYSVPLLTSFRVFSKGIKKLRELQPTMNVKKNANALLLISQLYDIKLTASDIRIIYVNKVFSISDDNEIPFSEWVVNFLDHDTVEPKLNYNKITII